MIVITGAAGQLGMAMATRFRAGGELIAWTRDDLDVTNHAAVMERVSAVRPALIINCSSYNDVDAAEDDAVTALNVNAIGVRSLARAAEATGATLVHYSSDFVFDGQTDRPYRESDPPSPRSVYAQSKLIGEWMAASAPRHYVLRVESLFGGPLAKSSVDRIIAALRQQQEARVFHDRVASPSFVDDVVDATRALVDRQAPPGLYHCVNSGHATWVVIAQEIARIGGYDARHIRPVSVNDVALRASRPRFAALDNRKLAAAGYDMPFWQDAIRRHLAGVLAP